MSAFLEILDKAMRPHAKRLHDTLGLHLGQCQQLASLVFQEVSPEVGNLSGRVYVDPRRRLHMLEDHHIWSLFNHVAPQRFPAQREANVLEEMTCALTLYVDFVYPTNELFDELCAIEGATKKCASYIRSPDQPVRHLRNAIAHGRWDFRSDGGLDYWDGKPLRAFVASSDDLTFWRNLVRSVAWPALIALSGDVA